MFKRMYLTASIIVLITLHANAQYYKIKWTVPNSGPNSGMINNSFYTVPDYKPFDMDNDGVSEIVAYTNGSDTVNVAEIYDGATYKLKYYVRKSYIFNGAIYRAYANPNFVYGFYDIDGDNVRELVCAGNCPTDSNNFQGSLVINVSTDQIEFITDGPFNPSYSPGFADIDNDGFIEMITLSKVIGRSTTPVAQSPFLSKKSDPMFKIYPNPIASSARIEYYVPSAAYVKIGIFDISGKLIRSLVNANRNAGDFMEIWDGKSEDKKILADGYYYYNIQIGNFITNKKVILLK